MADESVYEYSNGEVTIVWKPGLCIHSGNCVRGLPAVFNVKRRPWIDASAASSDEMIEQVGKCPSGALSYKTDGQTGGRAVGAGRTTGSPKRA